VFDVWASISPSVTDGNGRQKKDHPSLRRGGGRRNEPPEPPGPVWACDRETIVESPFGSQRAQTGLYHVLYYVRRSGESVNV
jgi:hypothetical protein